MYCDDMTMAEAREWLRELEDNPPTGLATVEQWEWDKEDLRERIAQLL